MTEAWWDPRALREVQYATDANLAARQSIYAYQRPRIDLPALVLDRAALRGDEAVADVGCGNGPGAGPRLAGDAAALPLRTGSVDVALALHMLYHLPDPAAAVRELRRVTHPGGRVLVVLNGADHLHELHALLARRGERRLDLDAGKALLAAEFGRVTREDLTAELDLPDATAIEAYARSIPVSPLAALPPGPYRIRTHTGILLARS